MAQNPFQQNDSVDLEQQLNNVLTFVVGGVVEGANETQFNPDDALQKGLLYLKDQDFPLAAKWLRNAALDGDSKAQFYMGLLFMKGQGVPQSVYHAAAWLSLAKSQGFSTATPVLDDIRKYLTTRRFKEAECYAATLYEQIHQLHYFQQVKK
ncbi:tetratricopeptide repeat protein [Pseudoalteromonas fenneropenaei]|uniref:Tetratricopeptide repeat protein n=1 Tax=Pseudoalteromonas fenneropenaei TaxID=1737459 RepID=A0ABV7CID0_9GAMM